MPKRTETDGEKIYAKRMIDREFWVVVLVEVRRRYTS